MSTSGANTNGKRGKFPHVLGIIPSCFLTPTFVGLQTLKIDLMPTFTFVCIFSRQTQFSSVSFFCFTWQHSFDDNDIVIRDYDDDEINSDIGHDDDSDGGD